mmetsp:Transcript_35996/g.90920  ORF Transcript_35996/g.90920 Transcript_35996/m.90920 type:complete len:174 (-) Transcript_35996:252-773(-)
MDRGRGPMMLDGPPRGRGPYGPPRDFGGPPRGPMMGPPRDMGPPRMQEPEIVVDREKTCPLLLRVFYKNGGHHKLEEFAVRGQEPKDEIQIYTWMDANLRELTDLIKEVNEAARARAARLSFAFVYPDRSGRNVMRQVGMVHSSRVSDDDARTLKSLRFQTGDYLDVAILAGF